MKKIYSIMIAAAVAFAFTSCEETTPDNGTDGTEQGGGGEGTDKPGDDTEEPGGEPEDPNTLTYGGVTYKTVTLSNGQTWMAEPLRYIPDGMTASSDPADDNAHIWYPYEVVDGTATAQTDEDAIAEKGYLYDMYAMLGGVEITPENCMNFEGAQGICPDGWHIPTWEEYFLLCGKSTKMENGNGASSNTEALFYDAEYDGAKIASFNDAGWNFIQSGIRMKANYSGTGSYNTQLTEALGTDEDGKVTGNCSVEEFLGKARMTYVASSTCNAANYSKDDPTLLSNIQFMSLMTTFTSTYSEGRLTMAFVHCEMGQQLRCIKDAE